MLSQRRTFWRLAAAVTLSGVLAACSGSGLPGRDEFSRLGERDIGESPENLTRQDAINFLAEAAVTRLETGDSSAFRLTTKRGHAVPRVPIGQINAAPLPFGVLLNQIAEQAGMSWRISGPGKDLLMEEEVFLVQRSETLLKSVLDNLSELTNAFYRINGDRIVFSKDRLFVVRVPRMAHSQEVFVDGLENLGAEEVFSDELSGTVSFRAARPVYRAVKRLMTSFEKGRDMIVYDFWLIDRDISDNSALGADFKIGDLGGLGSDVNEGEIGVGGSSVVENLFSDGSDRGFISGNLGDVSVDVAANFLRALGETETISRPTVSMLSGGESSFSSGEKFEYIRSVNTTATEGGTTSSGTDVRSLEIGVEINVSGSHNSGVISTLFELDVSELLEFQEFDTGEVTLRLPRTSQRVLDARLEARPGDVMVLGGIIRDRQEINRNEIVGTGIPTQLGKSGGKTETVVLVRPRLVQIRPARESGGPDSAIVEEGVHRPPPEEAPVTDIIEEGARAKSLIGKIK